MKPSLFSGQHWLKHTKLIFTLWVLVLFASVGLIYFHATHYVGGHVTFVGQEMDGMNRDEVRAVVNSYAENLRSQSIVIVDEGARYSVNYGDLGFDVDITSTVNQFFESGSSLWLKAQVLSVHEAEKSSDIKPLVHLNFSAVRTALQNQLSQGEYPPTDASIEWLPSQGFVILPEKSGRVLASGELDRIADLVSKDLFSGTAQSYSVRYDPLPPTIQLENLEPLLEQVLLLQEKPVSIQFGKYEEVLNIQNNPASWFAFDYEFKTVSIDTEQLDSFVADFAQRFDIEPSDVTVTGLEEFQSEYVNETYKKAKIDGEFRSGLRIDQSRFKSDLSEALLRDEDRTVEVHFDSVPVTVNSTVPGLEFPELISMGRSDYRLGHYPNRVHNIKHALKAQDLVVIESGETFSYNKILGWVTLDKGYQNGQVIFGNSVGDAPGGGVCQTSTTMFRAAVNAGLPILKRKNHSWDVEYYRDWYGVDAAIYPPGGLDLMFTNDTPGPILVHAYTVDENEMAFFELYGTRDGRQVSTEMVQNTKFGAGRKIVTKWNVTYADGTVDEREIVSNYRR